MSEAAVAALLETDALTAREPHDGLYVVHEDDLHHLVRCVLASLDHDLVIDAAVEAMDEVQAERGDAVTFHDYARAVLAAFGGELA